MNKNTTKNFKVFALILLTSALLLVAISPNISSVKAATTNDSVYVYISAGGTTTPSGGTAGTIYSYNNGTTVTFTATPSTGFKFLSWVYLTAAGGKTSTDNPFNWTISAAGSIQAMFLPTSNATLSSSGSGKATIALLISAGGSTVPASGTYTNYTIGTVSNFKAVPGTDFEFLYWIVATTATSTFTTNPLAFNVTANTCAIQAMFIPTSSTVTLPTPTPTAAPKTSGISTDTAIIIAVVVVIVIVIIAVGVFAYTKRKSKK